MKSESVSCSVVTDSLHPHELYIAWGSSLHGILQSRILEWVAISFSRASSQLRDRTRVSHIAGRPLPSEPPGKPKDQTVENKRLLLIKENLISQVKEFSLL